MRDTGLTRVINDGRVSEILIAGYGSIGRRHLANLRALGWSDVRLYRTGHSTLPGADDAGVPVDTDLAAALARRPIAVIVSNPTAYHVPVAIEAARAGAHLLIEKPLSHEIEGIAELESIVAKQGLAALVGFHFRFNPGLRQVQAWLREDAIGSVVAVQAHWGEYLPDWHPWEDYRNGYAARVELGGGVLLTLCHPFDYLRWLFGDMEVVDAVEVHGDALGLPVETCVDTTLRLGGGVSAHVHLDFVERPPQHRLRILGTDGTIEWNGTDSAARRFCPAAGQWLTVPQPEGFERNSMFLDEMRHFLACVAGDEAPACTIADGRAALTIALAARDAVATRSLAGIR